MTKHVISLMEMIESIAYDCHCVFPIHVQALAPQKNFDMRESKPQKALVTIVLSIGTAGGITSSCIYAIKTNFTSGKKE